MNLDGDGDKTGASANAACAVHSSELSLRTYPEFQGFCACECPHLFAVGALVAPTVAKSACISCTKRKIKKGTNSTLVVHCTHDDIYPV